MNSTNQNQTAALMDNQTEISPLKARLNRMAIHVPGNFPTPAEVIPIIEARLAAHMKHISRTASSTSGDFVEWKQIHDAYTELLTDLRPAEKQFFAENSARNSELPPSERDPKCTESVRKCTTGVRQETIGAQSDTNGARHETIGAQKCTTIPQDLDDDEDELDEENRLENNEDEDEASDDEDEAQLEADLEAELAGFENDAQRMAEAAEDLKAELNRRNRFDRLTAEQQAAIVALLDSNHSLATVVRLIAKPTPPGMNFKISKSGLAKFAKRYKTRESERRRIQNAQASADLLDKSQDPDKAFQTALERLLRLRLLTTSSEPDAPLETIDALTTILLKIRKQALAERKQTHAEKSK